VINSQKVHALAAQHRWLYHYRHLFIPLVGAKSHFFANLETEVKGLAPEKRPIVKFEEVEEQPKLILGGEMKDYQVCGSCVGLCVVCWADWCYSSMGCPSSLGCITMVRW